MYQFKHLISFIWFCNFPQFLKAEMHSSHLFSNYSLNVAKYNAYIQHSVSTANNVCKIFKCNCLNVFLEKFNNDNNNKEEH